MSAGEHLMVLIQDPKDPQARKGLWEALKRHATKGVLRDDPDLANEAAADTFLKLLRVAEAGRIRADAPSAVNSYALRSVENKCKSLRRTKDRRERRMRSDVGAGGEGGTPSAEASMEEQQEGQLVIGRLPEYLEELKTVVRNSYTVKNRPNFEKSWWELEQAIAGASVGEIVGVAENPDDPTFVAARNAYYTRRKNFQERLVGKIESLVESGRWTEEERRLLERLVTSKG